MLIPHGTTRRLILLTWLLQDIAFVLERPLRRFARWRMVHKRVPIHSSWQRTREERQG